MPSSILPKEGDGGWQVFKSVGGSASIGCVVRKKGCNVSIAEYPYLVAYWLSTTYFCYGKIGAVVDTQMLILYTLIPGLTERDDCSRGYNKANLLFTKV